MKKLLLALLTLISISAYSQTTGYLRYDTVRVQRTGGNSTLVIENATRTLTNGFLQNYSEGRTRFARALDSVWIDGDSIRFRYGTTTLAVLAPGGSQNLQQVTDIGNITTTDLTVGNTAQTPLATLFNLDNAGAIALRATDSSFYSYLRQAALAAPQYTWLPAGSGSDTLATLADVRSGGGGTLTLQDVTDNGNATTNSITVDNLFSKPSYTSNWTGAINYTGNGTVAYGNLTLRESSTGGGNTVTLSPVDMAGDIELFLPEENNGDTLATKAYARSVGGSSTPNLVVQRVGSGEQLHYVSGDSLYMEDIEGDGTYTSVTAQSDSTKRISLTAIPVSYVIAASDETTDLTTGTAKVTFRMPHAMTVTAVRASINTVSSSGTPTIDINEGGTTILSTKITIDVSEKTSVTAATPPVISDSSLADDAEITIDIDVSGTGAKGLKVVITGIRTI